MGDPAPLQPREFSRRFDTFLAALLIGACVIIALVVLTVAQAPLSASSITYAAFLTVALLVAGGFVFGLLYLPLGRLMVGTAFDQYVTRAMMSGRPWGIGHAVTFGMGLGAMALMFGAALAFGMVVALFWIVPTVVWLSGFHDVGVVDAATYAAMLSSGRPEYSGPLGMNTDPATVGFFVFCVIGWAIMLGALTVAVSPLLLWWRIHERRARARWWAEYRQEHGLT